jgi:hypothetical protein
MPLKPGRVNFLVVSDGAVLDGQHEDDAGLLPNFANDAIVPNTVTPAQIHASNSCLKIHASKIHASKNSCLRRDWYFQETL